MPASASLNRVHVIGATGRSGTALCASLRADGAPLTPVVRNPAKWRWPEESAARVADLGDAAALSNALKDATHIVSCAHARHAGAILNAAPPDARFVFLGSTRKFTKWPDDHGEGVRAGEAAFLASGRNGVMLHPTMIYGAQGEDNVQRLAALLSRLPLAPLPGGGHALVQPIHQTDVTKAVRAALERDWRGPHSVVIAGPTALPYAAFLQAVAEAAQLRRPPVVNVPAPLLMAASLLTLLPGLPRIRRAEIRRLLEDKAFEIGAMRETLGFEPIGLQEGLSRTFSQGR